MSQEQFQALYNLINTRMDALEKRVDGLETGFKELSGKVEELDNYVRNGLSDNVAAILGILKSDV